MDESPEREDELESEKEPDEMATDEVADAIDPEIAEEVRRIKEVEGGEIEGGFSHPE